MAAVLLPVALLGATELSLRLAGYGYSTAFFLRQTEGGKEVLTDNCRYGWRFFPQAIARTAQPFSMTEHKGPEKVRIFVLGESAAMGDPEPAFGFARILEVLLRDEYPAKRFEVVNTAMTAINSNVIRPIAKECAEWPADFWVVYAGNNEVVGPFGAGTVFMPPVQALSMIRARIAWQETRTAQFLSTLLSHQSTAPSRTDWEGMEMFLGHDVSQEDPRLAWVYDHFERNLDGILQAATKAKVTAIVCTVGVNLQDCPPFSSRHRAGLGESDLTRWQTAFAAGVAEAERGRFAAALADFAHAEDLDHSFAEMDYRIGQCLLALGRDAEARQRFERGRDLDTLRFRADSQIEEIIRRVTQRRIQNETVKLVEADKLLAAESPHGIPGGRLFYDHVHLNFAGNYLLARAVADQVRARLSRDAKANRETANWLTADTCAERLGWNGWSQRHVFEDLDRRARRPPFAEQLGQGERQRQLAQELAARVRFTQPEGLQEAAQAYRRALGIASTDWVLHEKLGELLREQGNLAGSVEEWTKATQLIPHHAALHNNLGTACNTMGNHARAEGYFRQALHWNPDLVEARNGLGLALAGQGRFTEAIASYGEAIRRKPALLAARVNLGVAFEHTGNAQEAEHQYRQALQLAPGDAAVHANLGRLLALKKDLATATRELETAVTLAPSNAVMHFNLGNLLLAQNQPTAALEQFSAAVDLDPKSVESRVSLGYILAKQGRNSEAVAHLSEAIRLNPRSVKAHLNLGIICEDQGELSEAIAHFREALRLEPNNTAASRRLLALGQPREARLGP